MRVNLGTIDVGDVVRRAIRYHVGRKGLATRRDVRVFFDTCGTTTLDDLISEMDTNAPDERARIEGRKTR